MSRVEILAPTGSPDALKAAVRCGADAVYLGASAFNARAGAQNFDDTSLAAAVAYCHARAVAVHLTLNTMVREDELDAALTVARQAAEIGVDALILQDRGLARRVRAMLPQMPLHASTQLSCHTPAGVRALKKAGFTRVVLAREMTAAEIAACAAEGCELEVFVHGALCMAVSGQCYLSAMLGGRSGNRGRCAQPCRLPFRRSDGRNTPAKDSYALSLRDLSLAAHFEDLVAAGVCSFKIEGRMKRPEYVAAATCVYVALRDGQPPAEEALQKLQAVFSRNGFTDGYYTANRGGGMFGHRRHEDVTAAQGVLRELARLYDRETSRVDVTARLNATAGAPMTLQVTDGVHTITVCGETAVNDRPPLPPERVKEQLQKSGGTPFCVRDVMVTGDGACSAAALNALRREALERLEKERGKPREAVISDNIPPETVRVESPLWSPKKPRMLLRLSSAAQLTARVRDMADGWFLPLAEMTDTPWGVEIPRGMFGMEETIREQLRKAVAAGARYALCGNVGAVPLAVEAGLCPVGGFGLNMANREAVAAYAEEGLMAATLSMELSFGQMGFARTSPLPTGLLLYGRQPLMLTRNCPRQCHGASCAACAPADGVTDRRGVTFPTACMGGCTELLNSVPLYWADKLNEVPPMDFYLLHFTTESPAEVERIVDGYRRGAAPSGEITRGLYRRGVE